MSHDNMNADISGTSFVKGQYDLPCILDNVFVQFDIINISFTVVYFIATVTVFIYYNLKYIQPN